MNAFIVFPDYVEVGGERGVGAERIIAVVEFVVRVLEGFEGQSYEGFGGGVDCVTPSYCF